MTTGNKKQLLILFGVLMVAIGLQVVTQGLAKTNPAVVKLACAPDPVSVGAQVECNVLGLGKSDRPVHIIWYNPSGAEQGLYICNPVGRCYNSFTPTVPGSWKIEIRKTITNEILNSTTITAI